ncbi:MAG: hypothetical protein EOO14_06320, partial [Chitinophagaceae bacterium]
MKRVLIISPYFPPTNAADMQRVRMSLPYFKEFGWEAEVVTVNLNHSDMVTDPLLVKTVPAEIPIHFVNALPKKWTSKVGLGNIALRSLLHYRRYVNRLLKQKRFDLIYFSTTQFAVTILGSYWKRKFNVPYVIDMQDPWHSDFYHDKPKSERPPKYWLAYQLSKRLEPIAMKRVGGLIAVSESYLAALTDRFTNCISIPKQTITFGAFERDFTVAFQNMGLQPSVLPLIAGEVSVVYVGRGGKDMQQAVSYLFRAFKRFLVAGNDEIKKLHFYFIGTSYAPAGKGIPTIAPIAAEFGVSDFVTEITDRLPFYQTLNTLTDASALFIPGSSDPQYTASKIYPYVLAKRPLLAIFHQCSSVVPFLRDCGVGTVLTFDQDESEIVSRICQFL